MNDATERTDETPSALGLNLQPGPKLASGRDADVFDLGNGRVLRRNRMSSKTCEREAEVMRYVREWGYPVPAVQAVSGPDMVMDRVDGPTMLHDLATRPWTVWQHARTLAALHQRLHGIPAPDWMPTYASHPAFGTAPVTGTAESHPGSTLPLIPDAVLHLDLHPDNVILSSSGPVVIDWRNTRRGDGAIDVATTWLIMATSEAPGTGPKRQVIDLVRRLFVAALLRHVDRPAAARQVPAAARYRLADRNLLASERPAIEAFVRRNVAAR